MDAIQKRRLESEQIKQCLAEVWKPGMTTMETKTAIEKRLQRPIHRTTIRAHLLRKLGKTPRKRAPRPKPITATTGARLTTEVPTNQNVETSLQAVANSIISDIESKRKSIFAIGQEILASFKKLESINTTLRALNLVPVAHNLPEALLRGPLAPTGSFTLATKTSRSQQIRAFLSDYSSLNQVFGVSEAYTAFKEKHPEHAAMDRACFASALYSDPCVQKVGRGKFVKKQP